MGAGMGPVWGLHRLYPASAKGMAVNALPSIFVEHDRVLISDGLMHGFAATVVPEPGKLALAVDEVRWWRSNHHVEALQAGRSATT